MGRTAAAGRMATVLAGLLGLAALGASSAAAQEARGAAMERTTDPGAEARPARPSAMDRLERTRDRWAERGVGVGVTHILDASALPDAGAGEGQGVLRGLLELRVRLDLGSLVGVPGAVIGAGHQTYRGEHGSEVLGDVQGFSNIDAEPFSRVSHLWYEQRLLDGALRWKFGRLDANEEFAAVDAASGFLNSSMGLSPTIYPAPTYPDPALGGSFFVTPRAGVSMAGGVYTAPAAGSAGGGHFLIVESSFEWGAEDRPGRLGVGGWRHGIGGGTTDNGGAAGDRATGWFGTLEQTVWWGAGERRVAVFGQYGANGGPAAEVDRHVGAGAVWYGLVPSVGDELGIGYSRARPTGDADATEHVLEAYYGLPLGDWVVARADVQRIAGGRRGGVAAWVPTFRLTVDF